MSTPRARIVRAPAVAEAPTVPLALGPSPARWRRMIREELAARLEAERIVVAARLEAADLLARAREEASASALERGREAEETAEARAAARHLRLREAERARLAGESEHLVRLAVVLAERLLGATLDLDEGRIADLAREVLAEAHGARRVVLFAHPVDASALRARLAEAGLDERVADVRSDPGLARGGLRLQTDVGTIDAQLSPRLEQLAAALRDALA